MAETNWYVVHTYSGYENKVKANIEKTIENRNLQEEILEVRVPMQDVMELKNGVRKTVQKKMFPGYVLINMVMNDDTWYVVRNTRGVTGFVGPGSKPVPLTEAEMKPLGIKVDNITIDFGEGDTIVVVAGAWKNTVGVVQRIDFNKQAVTINVDMFGRALQKFESLVDAVTGGKKPRGCADTCMAQWIDICRICRNTCRACVISMVGTVGVIKRR